MSKTVRQGPPETPAVAARRASPGVFIAVASAVIATLAFLALAIGANEPTAVALAWRRALFALGLGPRMSAPILIAAAGIALTALFCLSLRRQDARARSRDSQAGAAVTLAHAADELRQAGTRFTEAIEAISEGFALFDSDDRLVICNSKYRAMYPNSHHLIVPGVSFETILRKGIELHPASGGVGREESWIADRLERHRNPNGPFENRMPDGRWLLVSEKRTRDGGYVGVRTDITERKHVEQELKERVAELESTQSHLEAQSLKLTMCGRPLFCKGKFRCF